jgi:hypothetical protein
MITSTVKERSRANEEGKRKEVEEEEEEEEEKERVVSFFVPQAASHDSPAH